VALRDEEKPRLQARASATSTFLMLRNHGLLTIGPSVPEAFLSMYTFENTCRIQVDALAGGGELTYVNPKIMEGMGQAMKVQSGGLGGMFVWPSLIRKLDRIDDSYKQ
jgi:ribulose-5-phosphate 4-epimerase/fuculose-1-phosphate aldolase